MHIRKGCLSGIPAGHGTNRNERLHRDLNCCLGHRRYGVELAYALITSVFFEHNEKSLSSRQKRNPKPVFGYSCASDNPRDSNERFGLSWKEIQDVGNSDDQEIIAHGDKVKMAKLEYEVVRDQLINSDLLLDEMDESTLDIPEGDIINILHQAVTEYYVVCRLQNLTKTATIHSRDIFLVSFMAAVQSMLGNRVERPET